MTHEEIVQNMLYPIWESIDTDFKRKYRSDTWNVFENFIKTSACAESLSLFYEKLNRLLPMDLKPKHKSTIIGMLSSGQDYIVLNLLRTECSYLVLLTSAMNNEENAKKEIAGDPLAKLAKTIKDNTKK